MDLKELITYAEEKQIITLVEADELRNYLEVLEDRESEIENQDVRIEQLEDKLLETTDSLFRYKKECEQLKEKERAISIFNKKRVGLFQLTFCENVYSYNSLKFYKNEELTPKEFDLLRRYFKWT